MNKQALVILIFSSSILTSIIVASLSIDCNEFTSKIVSNKCKSDMNQNIIFISIVTIPIISGSAYYLFPIKKGTTNISKG